MIVLGANSAVRAQCACIEQECIDSGKGYAYTCCGGDQAPFPGSNYCANGGQMAFCQKKLGPCSLGNFTNEMKK